MRKDTLRKRKLEGLCLVDFIAKKKILPGIKNHDAHQEDIKILNIYALNN